MYGPRPKVRAMLEYGLPRCLILVLAMLSYMSNIATWLNLEMFVLLSSQHIMLVLWFSL